MKFFLTNRYILFIKRVYSYIYYRISCQYTAEDLGSQVFEKVMLKISGYCEDKSPSEVWLFVIARNDDWECVFLLEPL